MSNFAGVMGTHIRPAAESADYSPSCYRDILRQMNVVVSYTRGVSMRPLIWTGRHYVAIVPVENPRVGDIVLFEQMRRSETTCILHRLIAVEEDSVGTVYVMRGDNCLGCERIRREDIIGRVEVIYRCGGNRPWFILHGKEIHMTDKYYLRYVRVWTAIWPVRRVVYWLRYVAYRVLGAIKRAVKGLLSRIIL